MKTSIVTVVFVLVGACATTEPPAEPITWSAEWFQCDRRFECIAVYDSYCQYTAVNSDFSLIYQDWARQQVERLDELRPCPPAETDFPAAAYCRKNRCEN